MRRASRVVVGCVAIWCVVASGVIITGVAGQATTAAGGRRRLLAGARWRWLASLAIAGHMAGVAGLAGDRWAIKRLLLTCRVVAGDRWWPPLL